MDFTPLLALPLVGGYAFSAIWYASLYNAARESGHRLYFRAIFYSVFLAICAIEIHFSLHSYLPRFYHPALLLLLLADMVGEPGKTSLWSQSSKLSVLAIAFILGPALAKLLNKLSKAFPTTRPLGQDILLQQAIEHNDFEQLIYRSVNQDYFPILFTLKSGKAYVGPAVETPNPASDRRWVRILPFLSGYRDSETHELEITTDYHLAYHELMEEDAGKRKPEFKELDGKDFEIIIPIDQISSAHLFDLDVFKEHFNKKVTEEVGMTQASDKPITEQDGLRPEDTAPIEAERDIEK